MIIDSSCANHCFQNPVLKTEGTCLRWCQATPELPGHRIKLLLVFLTKLFGSDVITSDGGNNRAANAGDNVSDAPDGKTEYQKCNQDLGKDASDILTDGFEHE